MKKITAALSVFMLVLALTSLSLAFQASKGGDADAVAAITKYENDVVKADLANDTAFYENNLAEDWTGGTSRGTWDTKTRILADMKDTKNNKTNSESISELKVRAHGDVAIATYKSTYDALIEGQHYA